MDFTGLLVLAMGFASYLHAHLSLILEYIHIIVSARDHVLIRILSLFLPQKHPPRMTRRTPDYRDPQSGQKQITLFSPGTVSDYM